MVAGSVTSQWPSRMPPSSLASGSTRFLSASPCQVSAISAPAAWQALAMPQAIERLLATPRITPRLPCIKPEFNDIWLPIGVDLVSQIPTSPQGRGISGPPHRSGGTPAPPAGTAPIRPRTGLFTQARLAAGIVASIRCYIGEAFASRDAARKQDGGE